MRKINGCHSISWEASTKQHCWIQVSIIFCASNARNMTYLWSESLEGVQKVQVNLYIFGFFYLSGVVEYEMRTAVLMQFYITWSCAFRFARRNRSSSTNSFIPLPAVCYTYWLIKYVTVIMPLLNLIYFIKKKCNRFAFQIFSLVYYILILILYVICIEQHYEKKILYGLIFHRIYIDQMFCRFIWLIWLHCLLKVSSL